ncbi:hypothetical protein DHX103_03365 [Planococcus sp. X10-3]|uniref:hypothetical protein n=1 Tax=Planococcus sp. X10-3 TaxID=3061240 RepID=UPI003BAF7C2E
MKFIKALLFVMGLFFLAISSLTVVPMLREYSYQFEIANKYNITEINAHHTGASKTYEFAGNIIAASHTLTGEDSYLNGWDRLVYPADISITVNDENVINLENYPVRLYEGEYKIAVDGLNQYNYYLSYWLVEDQPSDDKFFAITIQQNGYDTRQINEEHIMEGYIGQEEFEYKLLIVREDGTVEEEFFTYQNKDKLQTQLISPMYAGRPGYYTDDLVVYPSVIFPLIYPFLTTLLGIILVFAFFPFKAVSYRKRKNIE